MSSCMAAVPTSTPVDPSLDAPALVAAARFLYGDCWQSALARDLHVASRTVRRWAAGKSPIPSGVEAEIRAQVTALLAGLLAG